MKFSLGNTKKRWLWRGLVVALVLFFGIGYVFSDALFFKRLVAQNDLIRPADAWAYLGTHIEAPLPAQPPVYGLSARGMLEQRHLYCDEGALLMATLLREMGYASRLVDLNGIEGYSRHTILEVRENDQWQRYDTLKRTHNASLEESARRTGFVFKRAVYRPTWNWYRSVVYYNAFAKMLLFKLRGIPA